MVEGEGGRERRKGTLDEVGVKMGSVVVSGPDENLGNNSKFATLRLRDGGARAGQKTEKELFALVSMVKKSCADSPFSLFLRTQLQMVGILSASFTGARS